MTAANRAGLPYVIIGGFAVIANQYVRGTEDVDLLIPEDRTRDTTVLEFLDSIDAHRNGAPVTAAALEIAETLRVDSSCGPVDLLRGGAPPLDFNTVAESAIRLNYHDEPALVASLASLVAFKRLADRPRDRLDLIELERIHGVLPMPPVPGVDD